MMCGEVKACVRFRIVSMRIGLGNNCKFINFTTSCLFLDLFYFIIIAIMASLWNRHRMTDLIRPMLSSDSQDDFIFSTDRCSFSFAGISVSQLGQT